MSSPYSTLGRRSFLGALLGGVMATLGGLWYTAQTSESVEPAGHGPLAPELAEEPIPLPAPLRLVSLSPGVTESIVVLGRSETLVGVSNYCTLPAHIKSDRVGSAITPDYEKIALAEPTLIITSQVAGSQLDPLKKLAPTVSLPWLSLEEWALSISELGKLIQAKDAANKLSARIRNELGVKPPKDAPRVLLALDYGDTGGNDIWFIRKNSVHGAVLHAAGAQNAVRDTISGQAKLSPEELLALDPDAIIVLLPQKSAAEDERRSLEFYKKWTPLSANRKGRIRVLSQPGALTIGPKLLTLVPLLREVLAELFPSPSSSASTSTRD